MTRDEQSIANARGWVADAEAAAVEAGHALARLGDHRAASLAAQVSHLTAAARHVARELDDLASATDGGSR